MFAVDSEGESSRCIVFGMFALPDLGSLGHVQARA
jgi:hypothetical protein